MGYEAMRNAKLAFVDELEAEYKYDSIFDLNKVDRNNKTIFVAIACYRDPELVPTIESAILNAKNPDRLHFGVALIYKEGDEKWWEPLSKYPNVKLDVKQGTYENTGLGRQRGDANAFFDGEDYYLQIDAHMRFDLYWDDLIIHHLEGIKALGEEKPLITGYPRAYAPDKFPHVRGHYPYYNAVTKENYFRQHRGHNNVPCFRVGMHPANFFKAYGFPRHGDRIMTSFETLALATAVSPAQLFAEGQFVKDVPANRDIRFLEEEQYYAILSYMMGYNAYTPRVTGIMHYYSEAYGQLLIPDRAHPQDDYPESYDGNSYLPENLGGVKVFTDLQALSNTPRSFADYEKFASIDYAERRYTRPVNEIRHNKITEYVNFASELYTYSVNDYIEWMYKPDYEWYDDVQRNEGK
jgi:Glycosyltransferase (GlcNAc)